MGLIKSQSGLWLPGGSAPRRPTAAAVRSMSGGRQSTLVRVDHMEFWAEDGQICWEDTRTGKFGSMFPDVALVRVRDMAKNLLGVSLRSSICYDNQDKNRLLEALRALERLAKEHMPQQPDRADLENLLTGRKQ